MKRFIVIGLMTALLLIGNQSIFGDEPKEVPTIRTFHIGNSLTDTVDGWLKPVSTSAGRKLDFHRFTIPGAPTDWLWEHPGKDGNANYREAFTKLAPIDHLFTQPFAGHDRSITNEAEFSGKFYSLCREKSPKVQCWLYVQWPPIKFDDRWSKAEGSASKLGLKPAKTWQDGCANHVKYTEAVRNRIDADLPGVKPVRIVPGGSVLARLKTEIDAGMVPGMTDFFAETFSDDLHLSSKGRYLVSLVHDACIFGKQAEGNPDPFKSGLTPEQIQRFRVIAWETAKDYRWAGIAPERK